MITLLLSFLVTSVAAGVPSGAIQFTPEDAVWSTGPASIPGSSSQVLEGDPKKKGIFTMRLKLPAGTVIAPHRHPREERVTVLSGAVFVGFGVSVDKTLGRRFPAGSFYVNPPKAPHFVWADEEAVVQLTGSGPWELQPVR